ncbi:NUDIX domain-containing protein [Cytophagaceae bacterium DM2B3-1]|uniref:NUDIX domain-containing protein n=2 Tax=Xanthocytophaga TaxID=3078918 RepID=A0AAE3QVY4_9BACT|nr:MULTISPECIES: NUDIX domain-containing protein [Xanthocytophaga]MDJ1469393.1 NUDIX domain-containing protein [Xanthocytophaga flavus]MDJ1483789.1 NUDIX domain-containing protein [Xanthocytophaga flavus]MDJ1494095.1 NUDIX domain-containing protein [Xanthocytophaga flavus]MDJ1499244.1 NUDIX domain-containing protein [Xanthocytophaga agilis]
MTRYNHPTRILVALDCIIFGFDGEFLKLLLIKRNFEPEKGKWSLMGGFLNEEEDLEVAAARILYELTGLRDIYVEQLQTFGKVDRDPVERTVSVGFFALINIDDHDPEAVKAHNAYWISLNDIPELIFDHAKMVELARERLRYKAALHPLGFELMPEKFTIPQLQKLYEAIYGMTLDRRNFSRKLLSTGLLIDTGEKNENSATKKATLYKLNREKYQDKFHEFWNFMPDTFLI